MIFSQPFPLPWSAYVRSALREERATPGSSMRPRRCGVDGRCGSSTGRSVPSFTSGRPSPKNKAAMLTSRARRSLVPKTSQCLPTGADQGPLRPRVPRPQGRVLGERPGRCPNVQHLEAFLHGDGWMTSASWEGRSVCGWVATGGTGWTCCSITGAFDVSWSSI